MSTHHLSTCEARGHLPSACNLGVPRLSENHSSRNLVLPVQEILLCQAMAMPGTGVTGAFGC